MPVNRLLMEMLDVNFETVRRNRNFEQQYEPMKKNRFAVKFPEQFGGLEAFCVSSTQRPSWSPTQGWCDITIKLVDLIALSPSRKIMDFIRWQQVQGNSEEALEFVIELYDPTGWRVERWEIFGLVTLIQFEELDYSNEDVSSTKITIAPIDINMPFLT
jgi:hypothetical protein